MSLDNDNQGKRLTVAQLPSAPKNKSLGAQVAPEKGQYVKT